MAKITNVKGRQVFDSRGNPTVEAEVFLDNDISATAISPSGASTGAFEAHELRDQDKNSFLGKSVKKAVDNINKKIGSSLKGLDPADQSKIDKVLLDLDGSENKKNLGANATLAVSLANSKSAALSVNKPLYKNLGKSFSLPSPLMNIINGGAHANNALDFQEIMIMPVGANTFSEALRWGAEIFHHLKLVLSENSFSTSVGDEGGFSPEINNVEEALELLSKAIKNAGRNLDNDINFAISTEYRTLSGYVDSAKIELTQFDSDQDGIVDNPNAFDLVVDPATNSTTKYVFLFCFISFIWEEQCRMMPDAVRIPPNAAMATKNKLKASGACLG